METNTLIKTEAYAGYFNIAFFGGMPQSYLDKPGVMLKWINIVNMLELTNEDICKVYSLHNALKNAVDSGNDSVILANEKNIWKYHKLCRNIIHDLRCTCDMLVILTSIAKNDGNRIESIGEYNKKHNDGMSWCYDLYCQFFKELCDLDNSSKHHFTNDLIKDFDKDKASICCVFCRDNWNFEKATIRMIPIEYLINQFNDFYSDVISEIKGEVA